jgi:uncharacterized protein YgbK (DUF1537 family)
MDLQEQLIEHLGLETALTPEQAAELLVGAAGYARDALRTLEQCTDPALGPVALKDLNRRAATIESHLRALYALALEHCDDEAVREIPIAVGAHLELASKCRSLVLERSLAVDQELMILKAPLPQYRLPC